MDYDVTVAMQRNITGVDRKSFLQLDFRLKRKLSRSVMEMIAPPGILVIVSWVKRNNNYNCQDFLNMSKNKPLIRKKIFSRCPPAEQIKTSKNWALIFF